MFCVLPFSSELKLFVSVLRCTLLFIIFYQGKLLQKRYTNCLPWHSTLAGRHQ